MVQRARRTIPTGARGPGPWVRPALRNAGLMLLVMGCTLLGGVAAMAAWSGTHPSYEDAVLVPAQSRLEQDQTAIAQANAIAHAGDPARASAMLRQLRQGDAAFVDRVLDANAPRAPELKAVHADLVHLFATLDSGLDAAATCLDGFQSSAGSGAMQAGPDGGPGQPAATPDAAVACSQAVALFIAVQDETQTLADRIAALPGGQA